MKLNNKGVSLLELLVSIVLVGIVLVFMFQLLVDLRNETENNDFAFNNQVNRTEVIYTIQKDLEKYELLEIYDSHPNNTTKIEFVFFKPNGDNEEVSAYLILKEKNNKDYITYQSADGKKYKWEAKGATIDYCVQFSGYMNNNNDYFFKLNIKLYTSHERNIDKNANNTVDDIEINHIGNNKNSLWMNGLLNDLENTSGPFTSNIGRC